VHELFEEQAAKRPEAVAVVCGEQTLSYAELNARANQLAHYLRELGVKPEERVATLLERSPDLVVAEIAVLKCGAAYVPIDLAYPGERKAFVIADSEAKMVLCVGGMELPEMPGVRRVNVEEALLREGRSEDEEDVEIEVDKESLAYIMYTSGSSGQPKGVMVPHRAIGRVVKRNGYAKFEASDRVAFASNPAFDATTMELWGALLNGGCTVVIEQATLLDPVRLGEELKRQRVSVMWLTVGLYNQYAEVLQEELGGLRYLVIGGDAVDAGVVERMLARGGPQHLLNGYGPTESTTFAAVFEIGRVGEGRRRIPIGRPIANTQIYVLDSQGEPVPEGVAGELYIGGEGVARGYMKRAELTAERFVVDPFVKEGGGGARMYRTGDLGRWLADGNIEFLGRNDGQVKIRGFRIELGEIEARLAEHAGVREAVVVAREDEPGVKRLVAYYTCAAVSGEGEREKTEEAGAAAEVGAEILRTHLSARLPEYMVPAAYVQLESLPLTANGKLDRRALPAPDTDAYTVREYEAPVGEMETKLAEIWAEVLKVERVGRQDNFFALGGHSLLAVRVIARLRQALGLEVRISDLFARPVLNDFARVVESAKKSHLPAITHAERGERVPLSFAQQRLWFLAQMQAGGKAYHIPLGVRLHGNLDKAVLKRALDRIVARHEALRTTFESAESAPQQRIAPVEESRFLLLEHDLRGRQDAQDEMEHLMAEEAGAVFDLEAGSLIRGRLVQLDEEEHSLLITMHHIVSDGWSMGILFGELSTLYGAYVRGEKDPLPELPVQYADYAVWQRKWMEGEILEQQAEYWRKNLEGAPELLELPADRARPAQRDYIGAVVPVTLNQRLTAGLKKLSARHGTTLYMTLLAGWAVLLERLSGQQDVVIGTTVANRGRVEIESLIGFFVNTLVMRVDLSGRPTVGEALARVKQQAIAAQQHQDIPFEQVVELVQPVRSLAHSPLFQVTFSLQDAPQGKLELDGLQVGPLTSGPDALSKFDLATSFQEAGGRIVGGILFATALYERVTIERYASYFCRLLEGITADSDQVIADLELLAPAERRELLYEWNDTQVKFPGCECIHELFEAQVEKAPDAVAVVCQESSLSYGDLNHRANQLARYLRKRGVRPDTRVAICLERSLEMVIALLAVLKAGGAYVPLYPDSPAERLAYLLEDSAALVLLTKANYEGSFPEGPSIEVISLDRGWSGIAKESGENLMPWSFPENLSYVIYTSGSTGRPKGVGVEHRQILNYSRSICSLFDFQPGATFALVSTFAADLGNTMLHPSLFGGGNLHLIDAVRAKDGAGFAEYFLQHNLEFLKITPSHLKALMIGGGNDVLPAKCLVLGGEAWSREWFQEWKNSRPSCVVLNHYGPTECTVGSAAGKIGSSDEENKTGAVELGKPLQNVQLYVLDNSMGLVPVGVTGELYVGGQGVTRGYMNRPDLTAEKFLADPFGRVPGLRLYRTGDRARWRADGNLEFRGRMDEQVKIRGFRVELGEIEALLREYPGMRDVVVAAREDTPGEKRLVAYYTVQEKTVAEEVGTEKLRGYLSRRLPEYMVPTAYIQLKALPLMPNGKLDGKRLPAPEGDASAAGRYDPPQGEIETIVAGIWAEVLKVQRVGRQDNFFLLGGHSLLGVQTTGRLQQSLGVKVKVDMLFASPVLSDFAREVERASQPRLAADQSDAPTVRDLRTEAVLDDDIVPVSQTPAAAPARSVFLTGASGFLGCFLLAELLSRTQATVHCLVRSSTIEQGLARIQAKLKSFDLWDEATASRIVAVPGDLSRPLLGLSAEQFANAADSFDAIYHSAAMVNAVYSYELMKAANVLGTREIIRMASLGRSKHLHYVSTLSVLPPPLHLDDAGPVPEEILLQRWQHLPSGYAQSKWVAEELVRIAGTRGLSVTIYRPGLTSGSLQTGAGNPDDFLSRFILAGLQLGCVPDLDGVTIGLKMLPVDYMSRAIVALYLREDVQGHCFNLTNDKTTNLSTVCDCLVAWGQASGFTIPKVPFESWWSQFNAHEELKILRIFFPEPTLPKSGGARAERKIDSETAYRLLQAGGVYRPPITQELLKSYIAYLAKTVSKLQWRGLAYDPCRPASGRAGDGLVAAEGL